jgi:hypothetical protein
MVTGVGVLVVSGSAAGQPAPPDETNVRLGPADARPSMRWVLSVRSGGPVQQFAVGEYQEGDVPMPQGTPWKCRWAGVDAWRDREMLPVLDAAGHPSGLYKRQERVVVYKNLRCSVDDFRTSMSNTGAYAFVDGDGDKGSPGNAHLSWTAADGTGGTVDVDLRPCPLSTAAYVPFCPASPPALKGRPTR